MRHWIVRIIQLLLVLLLALVLIFIGFLFCGPVSSPKVALLDVLGIGIDAPANTLVQQRLAVPEGFSIGQYAVGLNKVRMMAFTSGGDLLVSQPREGRVLLLKRDANGDGQHDGKQILLDQLHRPHGLAMYDNHLYVAESNAIGRVKLNQVNGELLGSYERVIRDLPEAIAHWPKTILVHNDFLYVNIGSNCNVCEEEDSRSATIMRFNLKSNTGEIHATGLRNSVGMDISPWDGQLYATDNGRDMLGDDYPVCELNRIQEGGFYGWPYINGFGDLDPDFGSGNEHLQAAAIDPVFGFRAHNAPLGIEFLDQVTLPVGYEHSALVALHGSWNRRQPDGYKVVSLHWHADGSISAQDFLSGFELNGDVIGRPVDIVEGPDGCVFISDDYGGSIYRVCYGISQQTMLSRPTEPLADPAWEALSAEDQELSAQRGKVIYARHGCRGCHSLNGQGNADGKALQQLRHRYTLNSLSDYFLAPNPPMPVYWLTEQQRQDLSAWLLEQTQ